MAQNVILFLALTCASFIDVRTRRLPDWITLPLLVVGLVTSAVMGCRGHLVLNCFGAGIGFLAFGLVGRVYRWLRGYDGLGLGDAKLLAAAGAWLGPYYLAPVIFMSALLAIMTLAVLRLSGREVSFQTALPFGPFLSVSFFSFWCFKMIGRALFQ